jgi:hypothetical protein
MSAQNWFFISEIVSGLGTVLVIVGLFKEYGSDVLLAFKFWGDKKPHRAHVEIETKSKRQGGALVVLGIAIELVGTIGIFATSLRIETEHRSEIADLNSETARVNERAANAERDADNARLELAKFKAPRTLNFEQQERITDALKPFARTPFSFCVLPEPEPGNLMQQIASALGAAGWSWKPWVSNTGLAFQVPGEPGAGVINSLVGLTIEISEKRQSDLTKPALALTSALKAEGIKAQSLFATGDSAMPDSVHVYIGQKP